jgi:hypothetical protein
MEDEVGEIFPLEISHRSIFFFLIKKIFIIKIFSITQYLMQTNIIYIFNKNIIY